MAAGTPGGRSHFVEPQEIACPASRWSRARYMTKEQRTAMDDTRLTLIRQGMRVVGLPVGTEQFKRDFLQEVINGEPV